MRRIVAVVATALLACGVAPFAAAESEVDAYSGLIKEGDWELVRNNCIACHSGKLITQQRGSREQWLKMIRWMQATQNLWAFEPAVEAKILDYLAATYPSAEDRRRAPIPRALMPPNPYKATSTEP